MPWKAPFPAAATTRQPLWNAVRTAFSSSGSRFVPPKLMLITPGQCCAPAMIPWIAPLSVICISGLASKLSKIACG